MENFEKKFLKDKYWDKEEFRDAVDKSAEKKERLEGREKDNKKKPYEHIPDYLERIENIAGREDPRTGERGKLFKETVLYPEYIIEEEHISDEYIKNIVLGNFAEQRGYEQGDIKNKELREQIVAQFEQETGTSFEAYSVPEDEKERVKEMVIKDQEARLDSWYDYLTSPEAQHTPAAFRYWAFAEMLKLGDYDPEKQKFNKRTEKTAASFPELDQQALALVLDSVADGVPDIDADEEEAREAFKKLLESKNFGKLYAFALEHVNSLRMPTEQLAVTEGGWRKFPQGSSPKELTKTLQGFNTKWCIAGEGYAESYLSDSDIWVYFSEDAEGEESIPRACIVDSEEHGITEVRGIMSDENAKQHLDDYITPVVEEKLSELPTGEEWKETMEDMKRLADIHQKHMNGESLSKEELMFLYEIDRPIHNSGYEKDPRIDELREARNTKEDLPVIFECTPDQIAHDVSEVNEHTKAYIGEWSPGIYKTIKQYPNIEYLYESFPDRKIFMETLTTDPAINSPEAAKKALDAENIYVYESILPQTEFSTETKEYDLVQFTVEQLGLPDGATTDEIYQKAKEAGLALCPAEVGPHLRLQYKGRDWKLIAMEQILGRGGYPRVWVLGAGDAGLELGGRWAEPDDRWDADIRFVFLSQDTN